mmetsp:Transcript_78670/g.91983  ORF Transcript_78670/g.91983 Transcript_78670/m.91983 type:complete len:182 (-) Transcript_78670:63-608(-)|eukprot:CAMPEP_0176451836 /NCGR_PEP_ID=MMETSP0127-20121128/28120_1 /TAXON_ID=938130 /ORGANISM="Platyophrya macrostoma, Strain WH" /LENGTH=181 /DNA_ID=CAMNT_0017840061 /DNA_START=91 /DNA_END=636 /DNA_ORIENTATION=+
MESELRHQDLPVSFVSINPVRLSLDIVPQHLNMEPVLLSDVSSIEVSSSLKLIPTDDPQCVIRIPVWMNTALSLVANCPTVTIRGIKVNCCRARCVGGTDLILVVFLDCIEAHSSLGIRLYNVRSGAVLPVVKAQRDASCPSHKEGTSFGGRASIVEEGDILDVCILSTLQAEKPGSNNKI